METTISTVIERDSVAPPRRRSGRFFYRGIAIAAILTVFAGFARTYFLKAWTGAPALPLLIHVHGLVFSLWLLLFLGQTILVARRRMGWHRRLGVVGGRWRP
ncbi:MAG TPA: hypothetical protein VFX12_14460 [Vicinamibacterales bacterium]|nr:hypothetical protein [Vicinamibacterales bacterium]